MTVAELIEVLRGYDQDLVVSVDGYEGGVTDLNEERIALVTVAVDDNRWCTTGVFGEHSERDERDTQQDEVWEKRLVFRRWG